MKAAIVSSLVLAATGALAVPTKRTGETVTISGLKATLSDSLGSVEFSVSDPNYSDSTSASLTWDRPGQPPADTWSDDYNYTVEFPNGVNDIEWLSFNLKRTGGGETVSVALNSNAADSRWGCDIPVDGTQTCTFTGPLYVTPTSS